MQRRLLKRKPRISRNTWVMLLIIALFGAALWVLTPSGSAALHRGGENLGLRLGLDLKGGVHLVYQADLSEQEDPDGAMSATADVIETRINVLGVSEPSIQIQKPDRIIVQLAGLTDIAEAKKLIGLTTLLEFRKQEHQGKWIPATGTIDDKEEVLSSRYFKTNTNVVLGTNSNDLNSYNKPLLLFEWNDEGAILSEQVTTELLYKPLGIFLGNEPLLGEDEQPIAPTVQAVIKESGQITGLSLSEAQKLSNLLNAGRIPVPLTPIYENDVSATLGADFVHRAFLAGVVGLAIVMLFMMLYYRLPGVVASLALLIYAALVLAIFKLIPVTLTLAGIAGFIVSLGMAVDANVLIFERMKEELRGGRTLKAATEAGFGRAWPAIRDSNVTTFIACGILYWFGHSIVASSAVMGFALTLFIGVAVSMFSAIVITQNLLVFFTGTWAARRLTWFGVKGKDA